MTWALARLLPAPAKTRLKELELRARTRRAHGKWTRATPAAGPLDSALLDSLAQQYPATPTDYRYEPADLLARGIERSALLKTLAPRGPTSLEIGSADAMTAASLATAGWTATAIDIDISRTDPRAQSAGVRTAEMDATHLAFPNATFDLVYSFNAFEHLPHPDATFAEMIRVLRPDGIAYVSFTALRYSPHGAHMYKVIGVPYVTVLFDEREVLAYLRARGLSDKFPWVNDYSAERFRTLFHSCADALDIVRYTETINRWHTRLISKFANVFKARAPSFDSLLVDSIQATFRRRLR